MSPRLGIAWDYPIRISTYARRVEPFSLYFRTMTQSFPTVRCAGAPTGVVAASAQKLRNLRRVGQRPIRHSDPQHFNTQGNHNRAVSTRGLVACVGRSRNLRSGLFSVATPDGRVRAGDYFGPFCSAVSGHAVAPDNANDRVKDFRPASSASLWSILKLFAATGV